MGTDQQTGVNSRGQATTTLVRCQKTRHCRCGQELDEISSENCPRCGTLLHQP